MTEQWSIHWDGASVGDADAIVVNAADGIGYRMANVLYESPFVDRMIRALTNGTGNRGVLLNWDNGLAVTGVASPVSVATGAAIDYGLFYQNHTAAINVAVPNPASDTRYDRIVIRRDWTAQTARITRLAGVEGTGYPPGITQSAAPNGTGIYDIPLASLSITTGGVIAITDEREFCQFALEPLDDIFATAMLVNEGADLAARATRTKRKFLGGGDLEPAIVTGTFEYSDGSTTGTVDALSTWGAAAASDEGWQVANPVNPNQEFGFYVSFKVPDDWAGGDIDAYVWWMDDSGVALSLYITTAYQIYPPNDEVIYGGSYNVETVSGTYAVGQVEREDGLSIDGDNLDGDEMITYYIEWYNTAASAEAMLILGLELVYTGYL